MNQVERHYEQARQGGEDHGFEPPECLGCQRRLYAGCNGDGRCPPDTLEEYAARLVSIARSLLWAINAQRLGTGSPVELFPGGWNGLISESLGELGDMVESMLRLDPCPPKTTEQLSAEVGVAQTLKEGGQ